ncbi:MAG: transcription-repair coupling factor [Candidatus Dormibacteria bacterium]
MTDLFSRYSTHLKPQQGGLCTIGGVPRGAVGFLTAGIASTLGGPLLLVTTHPEEAYLDCQQWLPEKYEACLFPQIDTLPFDPLPPSEEVVKFRLRALDRMMHSPETTVLIAPPEALVLPTLGFEGLALVQRRYETGTDVRRDDVVRDLVISGYRPASVVMRPGEYAVRGGILDVFPLTSASPVRLEWDGRSIGEIRSFRVEDQVARSRRKDISLLPRGECVMEESTVHEALRRLRELDISHLRDEVAEEWRTDCNTLETGILEDRMFRFSAYLKGKYAKALPAIHPNLGVIVEGSLERIIERMRRTIGEYEELAERETSHGELPGGFELGCVAPELVFDLLSARTSHVLDHGASADGKEIVRGVAVTFAGSVEDRIATLVLEASHKHVLCITRQDHRVQELLEANGISTTVVESLRDLQDRRSGCSLYEGECSEGFEALLENLLVCTDFELFGRHVRPETIVQLRGRGHRRVETTSTRGEATAATGHAAREAYTIAFQPGDLVVHRDHGIAKFIEMRHVEELGADHEYMVLEYADADLVFVPVTHIDRVDRYVGGGGEHPNLSRLGTKEWERTKTKARHHAEEIARNLMDVYARREMADGHPFPPDSVWQHELEESFPYEETEDQLLVLSEIKQDMEATRPMDRLVCGDVGFGKTELAIRAAFKAVSDGYQVAVLVPTTVLAQQHYRTFTQRLRAFPVTIRQLSRLRSELEMKETVRAMKMGTCDIVIGTHRLLQKDIAFKNLGLVILDEEQRFGVLQKERFKEFRVAVDVLSLSATPIPRTLHMSLAGLRDLSVIRTPPEDRQPIRTFVTADDDDLVTEVIRRELGRGGQVYYLHNRVATIVQEAKRVSTLVPDATVGVAHGQMDEEELAKVMDAFMAGELNVLVCTTIIESGLDIPNVNTIIIQQANRLGLAQLYQLRGRVGRSGRRAYAYLLYPPHTSLTEQADKRLDAIEEMQDLGSGFSLAMKDLEIRGAGNLLGEEQHGEIAAVGLELYNRLLRQSIHTLKGEPQERELPATLRVSLPLDAHLPKSYIADDAVRLQCYHELSECMSEPALERKQQELRDRFGPVPVEVTNLLYVLRVRLLAADLGITGIAAEERTIVVQLPPHHSLPHEIVARQFGRHAGTSPHRIWLTLPSGTATKPSKSDEEVAWQRDLIRLLRELARVGRLQQQSHEEVHA